MSQQTTYYFDKMFQEFSDLFESYAIHSKQVTANHYLSSIGEDIPYCYYIKIGTCRCSVLNDNGEELILSYHGPGSLIPVKCREFNFVLESSFIIKTMTPAHILQIRPADIEHLVRTCPDFAVAAVNYHTLYSNMYCNRQIIHTQTTVLSKVATFFYIYLYGYPTRDNCIALTQDEVASILGISRIQVARVYQQLRKEQIILSSRNNVQVLDIDKLKPYGSQLIIL